MANAKLEARVYIPTGGYSATFTEGAGARVDALAINLTATNTYYHSSAGNDTNDLAAEIQAQLNASATLTGTYTVTIDATDGGTGKYTIACDESFTITWDEAALRLLLGYGGNVSPATTSAVADVHAQGLWLPERPAWGDGVVLTGYDVSDYRMFVSRDSTRSGLGFNRHRRLHVVFGHVEKGKTWKDAVASTTNETWQAFWRECVLGEVAWSGPGPGGPVRFHYDADDDATYFQGGIDPQTGNLPERERDEWDGLYRIEFDMFETTES